MRLSIRFAAIAALAVLVTACGGGGGGDPAPAPPAPTPPTRPSPPVVTFPSAAQPAGLNKSNAKAFAATAWAGAAPTDLVAKLLPALALYVPGPFEQTRVGYSGGTVTFRTDTTQLWISMDFTDYVYGGVTFNGRVVHMGTFRTEFMPYDVTVELTNLSARTATATIKLTGTVHQVLIDNTTQSFRLTTTSNLIAEIAGISGKAWLENATLVRIRPTLFAFEQTYAGRAYFENSGYADISTDAPHAIVSGELVPDRGGAFRLTGGNASVGLVPLTGDYVAVTLDENKDGSDDSFARERWVDLLSGLATPETHSPAVANAGGNDITTVGVTTPLDALLSHDGDRSFIGAEWTMTVKPVGSATALDKTKPLTPLFTPDLPGYYAFRVRAVDPDGGAVDTVRYQATAVPDTTTRHVLMRLDRPRASAVGETVQLDASASRREALTDSGPLPVLHTYSLRSPFGSAAALTAISAATSTFVPDRAGFYRVTVETNNTFPSLSSTKHVGIDTGIQFDEAVHLENGGTFYMEPVLADLDGDGDTDIATLGTAPVTLAWGIRVFRNNGAGHFTEAPIFAINNGVTHLLHGDLDDDGVPDLVTFTEDAVHVVYRAAKASPLVRQFALSRAPTCNSTTIFGTITDADGNGADDLLVADACEQRVSTWTHTTGGTLAVSRQQTIAGFVGFPILFGDLNHDTRPDLVLPREPGLPTNPEALLVYSQQSNRDFQLSATIETTERGAFAIGDASGDGLPDLVAVRAPHVRVFRQTAGGSLLATPVTYDAQSSFVGVSPQFADLNGDGLTDLAMTARADAMLLGLQQANGSLRFFELPEDLSQGSGYYFALGDLDGNGIVDILRARAYFETGVSVRLGVP